jgi:polyphenol oxidase
MEPFVKKHNEYFTLDCWEMEWTNLVAGFTTKNDGFSSIPYSSLNVGLHVGDTKESVIKNKNHVSKLIDFPTKNWVAAQQTHGNVIRRVTKDDRGRGFLNYRDSIEDTDGFYTQESGILLTMCYADCVPIYFIDKISKTIGIVHAGWKGSVKGISTRMIETWGNLGINPSTILVTIGPSICEKCYIVDDYVINYVQNILEDVEKRPYNLIVNGKYNLDLKDLNKILLLRAGVKEENILVTGLCSSCDSKDFFSYRRDNGVTGRMMSFIGWKEDLLANESRDKTQ